MSMHSLKLSLLRYAPLVLLWGPLLATPLMLNVRWSFLMTPNEPPKWVVLVLLGVALAIAGALLAYTRCSLKTAENPDPPVLGLPGGLLLIYLAGLAYGVTYATNPGDGFNRLAFWSATAVTFWATAWAGRHWPARQAMLFQPVLVGSSLLFSVLFLYGWFTDVRYGPSNWPVRFSPIGHQNFTGDVLVVLIPLLLLALFENPRPWVRWGALLSLLVCVFISMVGGDKAAIVGLGLGSLVTSFVLVRRFWFSRYESADRSEGRSRRPGRWQWVGLLLLLFIGAAVYWVEVARFGNPLANSNWTPPVQQAIQGDVDPEPPLAEMWLKMSKWVGRRAPMWATTSAMIADAPIYGFGTGSFVYVYPKYSDAYPRFRDPENLGSTVKTNPHNAFLQIASENGLPLAILFTVLFSGLSWRLMVQAWREPSALWLTASLAAVATGFDALFNHVFFNPVSFFFVAIGFGYWYGRLPKNGRGFRLCWLYRVPLTPLLIIGFSTMLALFPLRWFVSEYLVAKAMNLQASRPAASPRHLYVAWGDAVDWSPSNVSAIYGLANLYYSLEQLKGAEQVLQEFLGKVPYHSAALNLLGSIKAKQDDLEAAEALLERALRIDPDAKVISENLLALQKLREKRKTNTDKEGGTPAAPKNEAKD